MKYVMFENQSGALFPVLFPDHVTHDQIKLEGMQPVSAGFVHPGNGLVSGMSESLKLQSKIEDELWLKAALTNNGTQITMLNIERAESLP